MIVWLLVLLKLILINMVVVIRLFGEFKKKLNNKLGIFNYSVVSKLHSKLAL